MSNNTTRVTASTGTPTTTQVITNRPFVAYEHGIYDPKDPFAKAVIDKQLADRLAFPIKDKPACADLQRSFIACRSSAQLFIGWL